MGLSAALGRMADGFSKLVSCHLALAKLELAADVKVVAGSLGRVAAFVPFVLVGYALLCGALAMFLGQWIGTAGGLAVVGGANVLAGGIGIWRALARVRAQPLLSGSVQELNRSAEALSAAVGGVGGKEVSGVR